MTTAPRHTEAQPADAAMALRELLALTLALGSEGAEPDALAALLDRRAAAIDRLESTRPIDPSAPGVQPLLADIAAAEDRALTILRGRRDAVASELETLRASRSAARAYGSPSGPPRPPTFQDRDA